jgi:hypothetical protein
MGRVGARAGIPKISIKPPQPRASSKYTSRFPIQRRFLLSLSATLAFTILLMRGTGMGLSKGKWMVPLDVE